MRTYNIELIGVETALFWWGMLDVIREALQGVGRIAGHSLTERRVVVALDEGCSLGAMLQRMPNSSLLFIDGVTTRNG